MRLFFFIILTLLMVSGCAPKTNEVSYEATQHILRSQTGVVQEVRYVKIEDQGSGGLIGAVAGAVLGSMIGKGKGQLLSSLAGGLAGAYVGNEISKANGEELVVFLDNGEEIVVVVPGTKIYPGDRVRIIMDGNRVVRVERVN